MAHLSVRVYAAVSGFLFSLLSIVHLVRLIEGWSITLGSWHSPMWLSVVALVIPAYLAFEAFHIVWPEGFGTHARMPSG